MAFFCIYRRRYKKKHKKYYKNRQTFDLQFKKYWVEDFVCEKMKINGFFIWWKFVEWKFLPSSNCNVVGNLLENWAWLEYEFKYIYSEFRQVQLRHTFYMTVVRKEWSCVWQKLPTRHFSPTNKSFFSIARIIFHLHSQWIMCHIHIKLMMNTAHHHYKSRRNVCEKNSFSYRWQFVVFFWFNSEFRCWF